MRDPRAAIRDLPLFWKLLIPYLSLVLIVGTAGAVFVVHEEDVSAQTSLNQQLSQSLVAAEGEIHDQEIYALEAANLSANESGVARAVLRGTTRSLTDVLLSVRALKPNLDLLVDTDSHGNTLAQYVRHRGPVPSVWRKAAVSAAARNSIGDPSAALLNVSGRPYLTVLAPICAGARACRPVGVAIAGIELATVIRSSAGSSFTTAYGPSGQVLASVQTPAPPALHREIGGQFIRVRHDLAGKQVETLYGALALQDKQIGVIATTLPTSVVFSSVRSAAYRFALIIVLGMLGVVLIGALLSRGILGKVRVLLRTNRALGAGDLDARADVTGNDEIGELAFGVNEMADRLQAAITSLASRNAQAEEEVQRLLKARTEFFASLSHEFRTPLAVIRTQADLLLERMSLRKADGTRDTLLAVKEAASQALQLVNEVLEVSRAEAGRVEVDMSDVSLVDVIKGLGPVIDGLAGGADLTSEVDVPKSLPRVRSDANRLRQILLNLVDNAVKYTPARGRVTVSAAHEGDVVRLIVRDTGVGIPADALPQLFEPFVTVPGNKTQRGQASSGLGLALTKQLVEAIGGSIEVESSPGEGTVMTVSLPVSPDEGATAPRQRSGRRAKAGVA